MATEKTISVRFLRDDSVHRVGEKPMTYKEGQVYALREDRAKMRIANGIAEEAKPDDDKVDSSKTVAGKDSSNPGVGSVDVAAGSGKGTAK